MKSILVLFALIFFGGSAAKASSLSSTEIPLSIKGIALKIIVKTLEENDFTQHTK